MITNVASYIAFFRSMAIAHQDIRHNPVSELGDGPIGSQRFTRIATEEVLAALNSVIGFPCLTLELYETDMRGQDPGLRNHPTGAFMVVDHPANSSFAAQQDCYVRCERIVWDILHEIYRLQQTPGCDAPFQNFGFERITITPVGPIFGGEHGYRVVFDFELQDFNINTPPAENTFVYA